MKNHILKYASLTANLLRGGYFDPFFSGDEKKILLHYFQHQTQVKALSQLFFRKKSAIKLLIQKANLTLLAPIINHEKILTQIYRESRNDYKRRNELELLCYKIISDNLVLVNEVDELSNMGISARLHNVLKRMGIKKLENAGDFTERDFLCQNDYGKKCHMELQQLLKLHNLRFKDSPQKNTEGDIGNNHWADSYKMSNRLANIIKRSGAEELSKLATLSPKEFLRFRGVGKKMMEEMQAALKENGLSLSNYDIVVSAYAEKNMLRSNLWLNKHCVSNRLLQILQRMSITSLKQITQFTCKDFLIMSKCSNSVMKELSELLSKNSLSFKQDQLGFAESVHKIDPEITISNRTLVQLRKMKINHIHELSGFTEFEIVNYKGVGNHFVNEIRDIMRNCNIKFKEEGKDSALYRVLRKI